MQTPNPSRKNMTTHLAFLRAINVGGHAIVSMQALAGAFEAVGCRDVRTFLNSGNVAFTAPGKAAATIQQRIQSKLKDLLGTEALVIFRTLRELDAVLKSDPFKDAAKERDVKLYVSLLAAKPDKPVKLPIESPKDGLKVFHMDKLNIFVVSRRVNGRSGFPNILVEKAFGVPATTRNWNTITKIVRYFS